MLHFFLFLDDMITQRTQRIFLNCCFAIDKSIIVERIFARKVSRKENNILLLMRLAINFPSYLVSGPSYYLLYNVPFSFFYEKCTDIFFLFFISLILFVNTRLQNKTQVLKVKALWKTLRIAIQ